VVGKTLDRCPGSGGIRTPIPSLKPCPQCGQEVEIWSDELKARCRNCGATVFKEAVPSCIDWCQAARECLGEEKYNQLKGKSKGE
jgi:NADH pyrophosphatase NudC (nudix superfamily)